jgi:hypothetical protein
MLYQKTHYCEDCELSQTGMCDDCYWTLQQHLADEDAAYRAAEQHDNAPPEPYPDVDSDQIPF